MIEWILLWLKRDCPKQTQTGTFPPPSQLAQSTLASTAVACWGLGEPVEDVHGCVYSIWNMTLKVYLHLHDTDLGYIQGSISVRILGGYKMEQDSMPK